MGENSDKGEKMTIKASDFCLCRSDTFETKLMQDRERSLMSIFLCFFNKREEFLTGGMVLAEDASHGRGNNTTARLFDPAHAHA